MARRPGPSLRALLFGWGRCLQVRSMLQIHAEGARKQVVEAVALQAYIPGATSRCGTQTFKNVRNKNQKQEEDQAKVESKTETSISYSRAIGRCDTAFRWDCDALFGFGRKPVLSAPPCRM